MKKFFQKGELEILWPFYLDFLLSPILFFAPAFYVIYFVGLNFSFFQISLLFSITFLSSFIFEIPTGAIADLYGRKSSVILGYLIEGLAFLSIFFVTNFYTLLLLFAILGFGATFVSGAKEAWIVDLIKKKNKKLIPSYFHKIQSIDAFALILSGILGAFLVKSYGLSIIWPVASISYLVAIIILLFPKEYHIKRKIKITQSIKKIFSQTKKTVSYGYKHHVLYYYLVATLILTMAVEFSLGITWTGLLLDLNFPEHFFGYMWSAIAFVSMITPIFSSKLLKQGREKKFIMYSLGISAFITLFILLPKTWIMALILLLTIQFFFMLRYPASRMYFHKFIPSKIRATMGSVEQMIVALATIIAAPIVGYLIDSIGARHTIIIYVPLIVFVIWIYSKINEDKTN